MFVESLGYRSWKGKPRSAIFRWWPILRTGIKLVFRRKVFWLFFLLASLNFIFNFAVVYFLAQLEAGVAEKGMALPRFLKEKLFTGTGDGYRDFISVQGTVVMIFLAFAGSVLVGNDFRFRLVAFYLSKPIGKLHYFFGKLGAVAGLTGMITLLPALILYLEYGAFTESLEYYRGSGRIFWAILGYGSLVSFSSAVLLLGIAALFQRTIPIVVAWGTVFVFLPTVALIFRQISRERGDEAWGWALLDFWALLRWISNAFFGIREEVYAERLPYAIGVLFLWLAASLWLFFKRVQAVEVVR